MSPTPMDEGVGAPGASVKKQPGDPLNGSSPAGNTPQNKTSSPSTTNIRYSPITPLAPLEYLQNQRRGSITDPSLHAGPTPHSHLGTSTATASIPPSLRRPESPVPASLRRQRPTNRIFAIHFPNPALSPPSNSGTHLHNLKTALTQTSDDY
ncbi:hypothetical protein A0H81_04064 [Grifola frondosa]|uniref:Uncharacterized protein n=1 Tax=Grifola frondosa TaxID=5627 RepID=A0A1C7MJQ3_GRIFR|nr:hypothetical protein A0H81_04064 [Grifola frondosa]